jgi:GT2 family glycosyltransferase
VIGAVLLRYNGDPASLEAAVGSIVASTGVELGDVVLVDNASTIDPGAVDRVASQCTAVAPDGAPLVRVIHQLRNGGFAAGVNAGILALRRECDVVLLLNDDAYLDASALDTMATSLRLADPSVVSVAPKMLLDGEHGLLDSVGMAVNRQGEAKNLGLGQLDLGQFDHPHEVFGPCFGAALIRRSAFHRDSVGPLREDYFMYYEDVEWNWRAQRLGFRSTAAPEALVWHHMSASSRLANASLGESEQSYARKHRCIERNLLATGGALLPGRDAIRLWTYRWPRLVKGSVTGRFPRSSMLASIDAVRRLPSTVLRRSQISRRAICDADAPLSFWQPEPIFFDPVTYRPKRSWDALAIAARLAGYEELAAAAASNDVDRTRDAALLLKAATHRDRVARYLDSLQTPAPAV